MVVGLTNWGPCSINIVGELEGVQYKLHPSLFISLSLIWSISLSVILYIQTKYFHHLQVNLTQPASFNGIIWLAFLKKCIIFQPTLLSLNIHFECNLVFKKCPIYLLKSHIKLRMKFMCSENSNFLNTYVGNNPWTESLRKEDHVLFVI